MTLPRLHLHRPIYLLTRDSEGDFDICFLSSFCILGTAILFLSVYFGSKKITENKKCSKNIIRSEHDKKKLLFSLKLLKQC